MGQTCVPEAGLSIHHSIHFVVHTGLSFWISGISHQKVVNTYRWFYIYRKSLFDGLTISSIRSYDAYPVESESKCRTYTAILQNNTSILQERIPYRS